MLTFELAKQRPIAALGSHPAGQAPPRERQRLLIAPLAIEAVRESVRRTNAGDQRIAVVATSLGQRYLVADDQRQVVDLVLAAIAAAEHAGMEPVQP